MNVARILSVALVLSASVAFAGEKSASPDIKELQSELQKLKAHRWEALSAKEEAAIEAQLRSIKPEGYIVLICKSDDCEDLAESLSDVFDALKWKHHAESSALGGLKQGIGIWTAEDFGQAVAQAISGATDGRVSPLVQKHEKFGNDIDKETQIVMGRKP